MERKYSHVFTNIVLKTFCKHYTSRSNRKPTSKVFKLSLNDFVLSVYISELIVIYTFWLMPSSLFVLLVEPSNFNENLNCTLHSIPGVDCRRLVSSMNVSVITLRASYLLSEILTTSWFCLILISVHSNSFNSFNFQHILLSYSIRYWSKCYSKYFQK